MPKFLLRRWHGLHVVALFILASFFIGALMIYRWELGLAGFILLGVMVFYVVQARASFERDLERYIATLSHRVDKAGEEAVTELPVGILLYGKEYEIAWVNPFVLQLLPGNFLGKGLDEVSSDLIPAIKKGEETVKISLNDNYYTVYIRHEDKLLYFFDMTETSETNRLYEEEQSVVGLIYLDNYDEVTQGMDDQLRSRLKSHVTSALNRWATEHDILLRSIASDRFIAFMDQKALNEVEKTKFVLLDEVREVTGKEKVADYAEHRHRYKGIFFKRTRHARPVQSRSGIRTWR
nr:hypothetical protein [Sinobaca sp. H24]